MGVLETYILASLMIARNSAENTPNFFFLFVSDVFRAVLTLLHLNRICLCVKKPKENLGWN